MGVICVTFDLSGYEKFKEIRNSIQIQTLETKINLLMKDLEIKDLKESMPAVENPEINNTTTEL